MLSVIDLIHSGVSSADFTGQLTYLNEIFEIQVVLSKRPQSSHVSSMDSPEFPRSPQHFYRTK